MYNYNQATFNALDFYSLIETWLNKTFIISLHNNIHSINSLKTHCNYCMFQFIRQSWQLNEVCNYFYRTWVYYGFNFAMICPIPIIHSPSVSATELNSACILNASVFSHIHLVTKMLGSYVAWPQCFNLNGCSRFCSNVLSTSSLEILQQE